MSVDAAGIVLGSEGAPESTDNLRGQSTMTTFYKARILHSHGALTRAVMAAHGFNKTEIAAHETTASEEWKTMAEYAERIIRELYEHDMIVVPKAATERNRSMVMESDPCDELTGSRAAQRALLTRAGDGLTGTQAAERLNLSEREVDELRAAGCLFAVPDPTGDGWAYPTCQFEGSQIVPGLAEVLSSFTIKSAWTRLYVLIGEDPALDGRTPIEALKDGDLDTVCQIVHDYGQQGGSEE